MTEALGPRLRTVERLCAAAREAGASFDPNTVLVAAQHLLATNIALFDALLRLGLRPENIYVVGKGYSTCTLVAHALRGRGINVFPNNEPARFGRFIESFHRSLSAACAAIARHGEGHRMSRLIVLDDGGRLLAHYRRCPPNGIPIVGIEQTTSGVRRLSGALNFPIVDVAQSAAKLGYESPLIAEAVLGKLVGLVTEFSSRTKCGVVGLGSVGKALVSQLERRGHHVLVAELPQFRHASDLRKTLSFPDILAECEVVFGCTGTNLFDSVDLPSSLPAHLSLASCSSEDVEFAGLMGYSPKYDQCHDWPAPSIEIQNGSRTINMLRGGYPVNFDSSSESARSEDIQLTTSLVLAGVLTALQISRRPLSGPAVFVKLPPALQDAILRDWFSATPAIQRLATEYRVRADIQVLAAQSKGETLNFPDFERIVSLWAPNDSPSQASISSAGLTQVRSCA